MHYSWNEPSSFKLIHILCKNITDKIKNYIFADINHTKN